MATPFAELIKSSKPTLVDFYADWCGPCRAMKPVLEQVKGAIGDTAHIIKIDVDKNQKVASTYKVSSIPTLIIFKNGQIKWRQAGVVPANQLKELIKKFSD